jgi:hypothetical protein
MLALGLGRSFQNAGNPAALSGHFATYNVDTPIGSPFLDIRPRMGFGGFEAHDEYDRYTGRWHPVSVSERLVGVRWLSDSYSL